MVNFCALGCLMKRFFYALREELMNKLFSLTSATAIVGSVFLAACGGGGGGGGSSPAPQPVTNQSVGGIWRTSYTASNGSSIQGVGLVAENGEGVFFSKNLTNNCASVGIGMLSANGSVISGTADVAVVNFSFSPNVNTACSFPDGSTSAKEVISGSVAARSSLTLSSTVTTSLGSVLPAQPAVTATFDPLYNAGSSLNTISGNWVGPSGIVMNINTAGVIFAQDPVSGCVVNGQVSIINPSYNAYGASATYSNCGGSAAVLNGVTAKGLMAVDTTVSPTVLYVGYVAVVGSNTIIVASTATK